MTITDVRVRKIAKEGKMKAIVSITVDDEFVVHDIKVIEGDKGLFIAMPSKKNADGHFSDIAAQMGNTAISPIPSAREPGKRSRELFWKHTIRHWKNRLHNFINKLK